ncbi:MAG: DUF4262 domain-containing protein [Actinomycetota bacterium]|nr:DUF4262 domain-containing protein [Actinomycetota bacterium]
MYGDDIGEYFAYTVGLSGFDQPELLVTGMPSEVAGRLLNEAGQRVRSVSSCVLASVWTDSVAGRPLVWSDPDGRLHLEPGYTSPRTCSRCTEPLVESEPRRPRMVAGCKHINRSPRAGRSSKPSSTF